MTFRAGSVGSSTVSAALAQYYLTDTVQSETMRAAEYYAGREERADNFWRAEVMDGRLEMGQHRAELRGDLSAAMSARLGLDGRPLTQERVANLLSLKQADGSAVEGRQIHRATAEGKKPPVGFVDLTFSASKSLSVAWGLAADPRERAQLIGIHRAAVEKTMAYVGDEIGFTRRGGNRRSRSEPGEIAWVGFQHYTSRPVDTQAADPNLHTHVIVLNHVMTETGHVGAIDLARMNGRVKEFGAVYEAYAASEARKLGAAVHFDERRETAQLSDIPESINDVFSKRSQQAREAAKDLAGELGLDWDALSEERRAGLRDHAAQLSRQSKDGERNDFASWSRQADEAGYRYESVLGRVESVEAPLPIPEPEPIDDLSKQLVEAITAALKERDPEAQADRLIWEVDRIVLEHKETGAPTPRLAQDLYRGITDALSTTEPEGPLIAATGEAIAQHAARGLARQERLAEDTARQQTAYEAALPRLEEEFRRRAVLDGNELRRVAAQALVTAGIKDAGLDIDAIERSFRRDGVDHEGRRVKLVEGEGPWVRGKPQVRVTTGLHVAQERELMRLARSAAEDRSGALSEKRIDLAARVFLSAHPEIDAAGEHWHAQRRMMDHLATGGRIGVAIGVPGSGKSFALAPLVQAWKDDGRAVYGISLAWRQAGDLEAAGITERAAIAAFLKRVETGRYELDRNSVVVVDEVGLVGSRQMLDLLRIQERTGAQFVMVGDPRQAQPIEGAAGLELLRAALGDEAIPRLLYSTRQHSEREREIAALFRRGQAVEALEMKQEDGTAFLVPGGRDATVARVAELWRERLEANRNTRDFTLSVSAPTNADAREIGAAIRAEWRRMGQLGEDVETRRAVDRTGETYDITLAIGERLRLFDRIWDKVHHKALANNGDVVELRALRPDGMMVRNAAGAEGLVPWDKIRDKIGTRPEAPVRLAYGYALTVDTAQGSTATEHIHALPSGSQDTHGFKTYVAATRHREQNWIVIDEASERGALDERRMIGHHIEVRAPDIWQNVAKNVARQPVKAPAISVLRKSA